jgi:hypothetical protein
MREGRETHFLPKQETLQSKPDVAKTQNYCQKEKGHKHKWEQVPGTFLAPALKPKP